MSKRARTSLDCAVVDVWKREVGALSSRNFAHRLAASEDLVLRLDVFRKLEKHRGCVNTVSFNADGNIVISGSDDRRVILWDWETGNIGLSFHSGHHNNVFQAKIMPYTDDRSIVTCAADGQVRHAQILECGKVETKLLAKHQGRAHKLAIEPASPHSVYTCGEDGLVQHVSTPHRFHSFGYGGYFFGDGSESDGVSSDNEDEEDSDMEDEDDSGMEEDGDDFFDDGLDDDGFSADDGDDDEDDDDDDDGFEDLDEDGNEFFDTVGDSGFDDSCDNDQDAPSSLHHDSNDNETDE